MPRLDFVCRIGFAVKINKYEKPGEQQGSAICQPAVGGGEDDATQGEKAAQVVSWRCASTAPASLDFQRAERLTLVL